MFKSYTIKSIILFSTLVYSHQSFSGNFSSSEIDVDLDNYATSRFSNYIPKDYKYEDQFSTKKVTRFSGEVLTIDTRNHDSCLEIQNQLRETMSGPDIETLCDKNESGPLASVIRFNGVSDSVEFRSKINLANSKKIIKETRNIGILGLGVMGAILALPEEVSHWERDDMRFDLLAGKWKENVRNGPVWDKDDMAINYIGHPYSGAIYYVVARHAGYSAWESFGYSAVMSSFFWEYGLEAFAEKPSIQDLVVTPILGALLGEKFYEWDKKIRANDGKLLKSKKLGSTALFLMNPAGEMSKGINRLIESQNFLKDGKTYVVMRNRSQEDGINHIEAKDTKDKGYIGLKFEFKF